MEWIVGSIATVGFCAFPAQPRALAASTGTRSALSISYSDSRACVVSVMSRVGVIAGEVDHRKSSTSYVAERGQCQSALYQHLCSSCLSWGLPCLGVAMGWRAVDLGRYRRTAIPSYDVSCQRDVCMHASQHQSTCAKDRGDHATSIALGQAHNRKLQMSILHCLQQYVTHMRLHRKSSTNHPTGERWRACLRFGKVPVQIRSWLSGGPPPMHV